MVVCVKIMSKGLKEALTVLIVTHVTHVKKVESGVCGLCTQYRYILEMLCQKGRKKP